MNGRSLTPFSVVLLLPLLLAVVCAAGIAGCGGAGSGPDHAAVSEDDELLPDSTTAEVDAVPADTADALDMASALPKLALSLTTELDTSPGTVKATSITSAELLNTSRTLVKTAVVRSGVARFGLTGLTAGHYFIRVNGLNGDLVPTRIDNPAVSVRQYVGQKLRSSVIGSLTSPRYRIETYPGTQGLPRVVKYSDGTTATPRGYAYVLMKPRSQTMDIRYIGTARLLTRRQHDGPHNFESWMLGPNNHGKTGGNCSGCHGSTGSHPAQYTSITKSNGWCFMCHYGPDGAGSGMVKPTQ